ncbi:MAG: GEVED domain-containing protein, partial [Bacteroidia bacterium]
MTTNYKRINSIVLSFLIGCNVFAQNGPGGVGSTDGTSVLTHWLDASSVSNVNVATWPDKSGYNNGASGTGAQLKTNEINGQPAVKFDGSSRTYYVDGKISNPYTIFSVAKQDGGNHSRLIASNDNNWLFGYWGGLEDVWHPDTWVSYPGQNVTGNPAIYTGTSNGSTSSFYKNGNLIANSGGVSAPDKLRLGGWRDYNELSDGKISEVIVYSTVLNSVQRILVENYLNAKYNLPIATDKYAQPSATAYIKGVSGIGKEDGNTNPIANAGGFVINNVSFLQDDGDYILAGYDLSDNSVTTYNDLPVGVVRRFARDWFVDFTDANANNGVIDLGFKMSETGYKGMPSGSGYKLLYRATESGNYTVINSVPTIFGDHITFSNINTSTLDNGYYTLALPAATPLTIVDITTLQASLDTISAGRLNNNIITVKISTVGDSLADTLNSTTFNNIGTTKNSDITNYYLYAGTSPNFVAATLLATSSDINLLTFSAMPLPYGDSYFFLTADIHPLATVKDTVDGQCTLVTLSSGSIVPSITSPAGYRIITPVLYCLPYTNGNCCQTGISNFTSNNINNSSTPDNQYSNYTNLAVEAYKNEPLNFSITTRDNMISTIWVDWNKDGIFDNINEQMFHSGIYDDKLNGSFIIPASVVEGDSVRMRVGTGYRSQPMTDPCFQLEHAEWEDYTLKIKNSVNMTYTANAITQSDTADVARGDVDKIMLRVVVETNGNLNPLNITNFDFNTLGSSNSVKDISNYKLFKGDKDSTFSNATLVGQANSLAGLSFSAIRLFSEKNYFWLTYDISDFAAFDNKVDAGITAIIMDGGVGRVVASTPNPLGKRTITPCHPTLIANCCNYGINKVSFNYGSENTTGYDNYTDYSHTIGTNTFADDSVHFSIANNNDQHIAIWVDWNKNRDFESSEQVYTGYNNTTGVFSGDFQVPSFMTSPDTVKIRIATGNTPPTPCTSQYGEFEDYALFINTPKAMIHDSSSVFQDASNGNTIGNNVIKGTDNNLVLGVNVFTKGNLLPVKINALVLNTNGTANTSDITKYSLYFGGLNPIFANAKLIKSVSAIDTLRFDALQMGTGKNYFWLAIDVDKNAVTGNQLDFECTSIFIDSIWKTPSIIAPTGYYVVAEDQYPFGNNSWIAYAFDGYNFDTYKGYYSVGGLDFNSRDSWNAGGSPSSALGYSGLPVGNDNHSVQYKRKGFPNGKYQLDIPGHDDDVTVYLNGVSIFVHHGCCDSHTNIWTGILDASSKITYAWQEGGGESYGALKFTLLCNPTTSDTTAITCNSFTWYGNTYTLSGNPTRIIPNAEGCDSTITLHLTINSTASDTTAIACNSFTWYGSTYTTSGTPSRIIKNAKGCDSIITLHLTINKVTSGDTTAIACNSFTWYGSTYTVSGNQTRIIPNTKGCDSTITLHLTINKATSGDTTAIACNSFTWYGNTYTTSGTTSRIIKNAKGCDSTITLHLTINYSTTNDTTATACNSFTWYGSTYTTSGTPSRIIKNAKGCDSTITLHLTINKGTTGDTTATACNSFTWYGNTYTTSGNQTRIILNAKGCDSTITLHLTINKATNGDTTAIACNSFTWYGNTYTSSGNPSR